MNNGIVNIASPFSVPQTLDRLETALCEKGIKIFVRIDQKMEAEAVGLILRPTQLLIFGDPKTGTPLMDAYPSLALDLPLKALAWEAPEGQVWLSYDQPSYLQARHGLPQTPFSAVEALIAQVLR